MLVVVDYGMGNLRSVEKAFEAAGERPVVSSDPKRLEKASKIVLPGVGAFTQAMGELKKLKLIGPLKEKIQSGTPYLGLCLGLQLLFSFSEEGNVKGLGILPGRVRRFRGDLKVPHMGWNTLSLKKKDCPLLHGVSSRDYFYFVHSFYAVPDQRDAVLSTTRYGVDFCSSVWKGNIFATQFHPEKSQTAGLRLVENFIAYEGVLSPC